MFIEGMEESVVKAYWMTDAFHHCTSVFPLHMGMYSKCYSGVLVQVTNIVLQTTKAGKFQRRFITNFFRSAAWDDSGLRGGGKERGVGADVGIKVSPP